MAYRDQLYPWCVVRTNFSPDSSSESATQPLIVARFRRRGDAEAQLKLLQQLTPQAKLSIQFARQITANVELESSESRLV